jgi:hypothetical protein
LPRRKEGWEKAKLKKTHKYLPKTTIYKKSLISAKFTV